MFQSYLFDLDGTLIDSIALIVSSFRHTRAVHFGDVLPDEHWIAGIGKPLRTQLAAMARSEHETEAMIATYREYNFAHHDAMVRPYDGVVELIAELRRRNRRLGLVTSKLRDGTLRGLDRAGLRDAFDVTVCADDVERGKHDCG